MNITERIANLEQELASLKAECNCEVDWSKVPAGTFVEVRDHDKGEWSLRSFHSYCAGSSYPFKTIYIEGGDISSSGCWAQCRLAPRAPSIMNWVAFDGTKPDLPDDTNMVFIYQNGGMGVGPLSQFSFQTDFGLSFNRKTHYAVIEGPK